MGRMSIVSFFFGVFFIISFTIRHSSGLSTFPFSSPFSLPSPVFTYAVVVSHHHSNYYLPRLASFSSTVVEELRGWRRGSRKREKWKKLEVAAEEREDTWKEERNQKQKKINIRNLRFAKTNNKNNRYYNDNNRMKKSDNNRHIYEIENAKYELMKKRKNSFIITLIFKREGFRSSSRRHCLFFSAANNKKNSRFFSTFFFPLSSIFTSSSSPFLYFSTFIFPFSFWTSSFSLSSPLCNGGVGGGGGGVSRRRSSSSTILFTRPKSRSRRLLRRSTELGCPPRFRYVRTIERHFDKTANFSSLPPPSDPDYCPPIPPSSPYYSRIHSGLPPIDDPVEKDEFLPVIYSAVRAADLHKAEEIVVQRLKYCTLLTDFALTLHGKSLPQLRAIAHAIEITLLKEHTIPLKCQDGRSDSGWIAIDFGRLMVHVMTPSNRAKYKLEEVHPLAENINISHILRKNRPEEFDNMAPHSNSPFYSSSSSSVCTEKKSKSSKNAEEADNVLVSSSFASPMPDFLMWKGDGEEGEEEIDPFWS